VKVCLLYKDAEIRVGPKLIYSVYSRGYVTMNTASLQSLYRYHSPIVQNYNLYTTLKVKAAELKRTRISDEISFLICQSCFWCASYFNYPEIISRCPTCDSNYVESLPISNSESYTFSYDRNRGVTLEFLEKR
jgi:hypothetical protein